MPFTPRKRTATAGAFAAAALLTLAACGGSSSGSGGSSTPSASAGTAGTAAVHTVKNATLGTLVVNGKGFTLYRFDMDSAKPSASHCTGACATAWPAAPAAAAGSVQGVDHQLIGSVTGTGGEKQLTIDGWPVYTYSQDGKAGDTHGQGVGGTWFAVTPSGGKAAATTSGPATTSPSSGGYGY